MKSITPKQSRVKHQVADLAITSVDELIRALPKNLTHVESAMRHFPHAAALLHTIMNCMAAGMTDDAIDRAVVTTGAWHAEKGHRCTTCLGWTDKGYPFSIVEDGELMLVTLCEKCVDHYARKGRITAAMQRNFDAYLGGAK